MMSAGQSAEYAGWIIGGLLGFLFGLFMLPALGLGWLLILMIVGAFIGGAIGYAAWMLVRR